jgi:Kelch motif
MKNFVVVCLAMVGCQAGAVGPNDGGGGGGADLLCPLGTHAVADGCDASLGWRPSGAIAPTRDHHGTFVVPAAGGGAVLYVIGGTDHFTSVIYDDVQRAAIAPDGTVGTLQPAGTLPSRLASMGVAVVGDRVVIAGGVGVGATGNMILVDKTWVAPLAADGTLGAWQAGPAAPPAREHTSLLVRGRDVYIVGGLVGATGTTNVSRTTLAADGTLAPWLAQTALPAERSHHASVLTGDAIYVVGGLHGDPARGGQSYFDVLRAPLAADGSVGAWTQVSNMPDALATHSATTFAGRLYVIGGMEDDIEFVDHVRRATVGADGALGAWEDVTSSLPRARGHVLETPVWERFVFSVAGYTNDATTIADVVVGTFE